MAGLPQNIGVKQCFGLTLSYWSVEYLNVTAGQTNRTKIVLTTTLTPEHNNTSQTAINGNRAASRLYNCINAGSYKQSFTVSSASYDPRALYVWSCRAVCVSTVCAVNLCELLTCLLLKITLITCGLNTSLFSGLGVTCRVAERSESSTGCVCGRNWRVVNLEGPLPTSAPPVCLVSASQNWGGL